MHFTESTTYLFKPINRAFCYLKPQTFLIDSACVIGILGENRGKQRKINEEKEKEKVISQSGKKTQAPQRNLLSIKQNEWEKND